MISSPLNAVHILTPTETQYPPIYFTVFHVVTFQAVLYQIFVRIYYFNMLCVYKSLQRFGKSKLSHGETSGNER
jgi:hypothetical protein